MITLCSLQTHKRSLKSFNESLVRIIQNNYLLSLLFVSKHCSRFLQLNKRVKRTTHKKVYVCKSRFFTKPLKTCRESRHWKVFSLTKPLVAVAAAWLVPFPLSNAYKLKRAPPQRTGRFSADIITPHLATFNCIIVLLMESKCPGVQCSVCTNKRWWSLLPLLPQIAPSRSGWPLIT